MNKAFYNKLERQMRTCGSQYVRREALEETQRICRQVEKRIRPPMSKKALLFSQLRFAGGKIWALEASVLAVLWLMIHTILRSVTMEPDTVQICLFLSISAVASAMAGTPYLCRSFRYHMYEVESAVRVSFPRLQAIRLLMAVGGSLIMTAVLFAAVYARQLFPLSAAVYMLLPFLCIWTGSLLITRAVNGARSQFYCISFGAGLMAVLFFLGKAEPRIFEQEAVIVWGGLCIVMFGVLLLQVRNFRRKLWN